LTKIKYTLPFFFEAVCKLNEEACGDRPHLTLSPGMGNEYQPKCGDALWLVSKGRYGSFHLWINVWVAGKTV